MMGLQYSMSCSVHLILISLSVLAYSSGWTIETIINPDCDKYDSCINHHSKLDLLWSRSSELNRSLHFISSIIDGYPAFLITRTSSMNDSLHVNWDSLLNGSCVASFNFPEAPNNSIAIQILSFFDIDRKDLDWKLNNNSGSVNCDSSMCQMEFITEENGINGNRINKTVSLAFEITAQETRSKNNPHLLIKPESIYLDIKITNLNDEEISAKIGGIKLLIVSSGELQSDEIRKSINDEYSPGIFEIQSLRYENTELHESSYIQWRPIAYNSIDRILSKTMKTNSSSIAKLSSLPKLNPVLSCFYDKISKSKYNVGTINITFLKDADSDSGSSTSLIAWGLVFGLDDPPKENLSIALQAIIYAGVGIPFILMLASAVYVSVKKWRRSSSSREPNLISEDILDY